jgi:membrane protease YdiL (CAAX protease family)
MTEQESSLPQPLHTGEFGSPESMPGRAVDQPPEMQQQAVPLPFESGSQARLPLHGPRQIPNLAHTLLLLVIAGISLFVTEIAAFGMVLGMHLFGNESPQVLLRDPRLLVPSMAISYLVAGALSWAVFTNLWRQPFSRGLRWNGAAVQRRFYAFLGVGVLLSVAVQLLSNYLPIPKALPIDDFFRTRTDLWMVAVFGTFVAPAFEELAFRGFLFPSLASAWDWVRSRGSSGLAPRGLPPNTYRITGYYPAGPALIDTADRVLPDPQWSSGALIFSASLTSVGFALLHADQLGHSWAPLLVLFTVSLVLCLVRLRAHSLAASTLVHAAYNGAIFALLFYATDGFRHLEKMNQ